MTARAKLEPGITERRDLERSALSCNALIRLAEYLTFRAQLVNISADAVQIACDARYALLIQPGGIVDESRQIDISIALPHDDRADDFKASCRVKYCVNAEANQMVLGLQFVTMDFRSVQYLDRFMESQRS